ncbi:MAG TPA: DUF4331 family protein [Sphingomicrobium sp.]|nr:DUF4331 family protein [Sphingomicrobium sp.]
MNRWMVCGSVLLALAGCQEASASDHLDTRTVIEDPRADIGDIYAWMSEDRRRLNLVMTIVGHSFSPDLEYAFHIDSGPAYANTKATESIRCRMPSASLIECKGAQDFALGNASQEAGIESRGGHFRLFAGLRDDPFFNNVRGSRDAYLEAATAIELGAPKDRAGCWQFSPLASRVILDRWRHTEGGPAKNFLAGWTPASLVISVDLEEIAQGGSVLGIWASVSNNGKQVDRMGRPLTGNAMLSPIAQDDVSDRLKEDYNAATPADADRFVPEIEKTLGLYDAFDGQCGNGLLARPEPEQRYRPLAKLLADDRLWVDSRFARCAQFMAVERLAFRNESIAAEDCGGRNPLVDAIDVYRSLLATGMAGGVDDGVDHDEREHPISQFPFLAAP